jgi:hypothetical protein
VDAVGFGKLFQVRFDCRRIAAFDPSGKLFPIRIWRRGFAALRLARTHGLLDSIA